jgi:hypothetical protein
MPQDHFVPQFYLRNFSIQSNSKTHQIEVFDKKLGSFLSNKTNINNIAKFKDYYEYEHSIMDFELFGDIDEAFIKDIDSRSAPIWNKLSKVSSLTNLESDEKKLIADFLALQMVRVPVSQTKAQIIHTIAKCRVSQRCG